MQLPREKRDKVLNTEDVGHYGELTLKPMGGPQRISVGRVAFYLLGLVSVWSLWQQFARSEIQVSSHALAALGVTCLVVAALAQVLHLLRHGLGWTGSSKADGRARLACLQQAMDRPRVDYKAA